MRESGLRFSRHPGRAAVLAPPESPDELFDAFHEGAVRATAMLRSQPAEARENIRSAVRAEVERLRVDDRFVISVPAALSWARKP